MMENTKKITYCCICGKELKGWGNSPWGAMNDVGEFIEWKDDDVCCDECDMSVVLPGRLQHLGKQVKREK